MATLANVQIADKGSPFDSGGAYLLAQKCDVDETVSISPDREVEVRKNSPYVVARIKGAADAMDAFNKSHEVVQQALDLLSAQGKVHLSTRNVLDERLVWWRGASGQILRFISVAEMAVKMGLPKLIVKDKDGNVVPAVPPPPVIHHECFRYFRLSQVTDSLFDAFRNMYLAFESLLEYVAPRLDREKEGHWFKRALKTADSSISLSKGFTPTTSDVVADIYDQIYVGIRCAIFHSKSGPRLLPQNLSHRDKVNDGLRKVTGLVLLLAEHFLHSRYMSGGLTNYAFSMSMKSLFQSSTIIVSDSDLPIDKSDTLDSPAFRCALEMKTVLAPELSEPGLAFVIGTIKAADLGPPTKVARFGVKHNSNLAMSATIEAELKYEGIDLLEAQLGVQLRNVREPKRLYTA